MKWLIGGNEWIKLRMHKWLMLIALKLLVALGRLILLLKGDIGILFLILEIRNERMGILVRKGWNLKLHDYAKEWNGRSHAFNFI